MRKTITSSWAFFFEFPFILILITTFLYLQYFLYGWQMQFDTERWIGVSIFFVYWFYYIFQMFSYEPKQVSLDEENIYFKDEQKAYKIPIQAIEKIKEVTLMRPRHVRIVVDTSYYNKPIQFIPPIRFSYFFATHPIVKELIRRMSRINEIQSRMEEITALPPVEQVVAYSQLAQECKKEKKNRFAKDLFQACTHAYRHLAGEDKKRVTIHYIDMMLDAVTLEEDHLQLPNEDNLKQLHEVLHTLKWLEKQHYTRNKYVSKRMTCLEYLLSATSIHIHKSFMGKYTSKDPKKLEEAKGYYQELATLAVDNPMDIPVRQKWFAIKKKYTWLSGG